MRPIGGEWAVAASFDLVFAHRGGQPAEEQAQFLAESEPKTLEKAKYHNACQTPHRVKFTRPLWLGAYTVTQAKYEKVVGVNPSMFAENQRDATVFRPPWGDKKKGRGDECPRRSPAHSLASRVGRVLADHALSKPSGSYWPPRIAQLGSRSQRSSAVA